MTGSCPATLPEVLAARAGTVGQALRGSPWWALSLVSFGFLLLQILLTDHHRLLEYDEAQYLSQVLPDAIATGLGPHRSRGIIYLIAPAAMSGADLSLVRVYLSVVSAGGLALAFGTWIPLIGQRAAVAAGILGTSWISLFYGSEIQPNFFVALAGVAIAGLIAGPGPAHRFVSWPLLLWSAAAAALRPTDAGVVLASMLGFTLIRRKAAAARTFITAMVGALIGMLPWLVESYARFGGPVQRLAAARAPVGQGVTFRLLEHLAILDGPLIGPDRSGGTSLLALGWWLALGLLGVVGVRKAAKTAGVMVSFVGATATAVFYFTQVGATAPRFLLPAYALIAIPASVGLAEVWRRAEHPAWRSLVLMGLAPLVLWNLAMVGQIDDEQIRARQASEIVGSAISSEAKGAPCVFFSQYAYPQIQVESGCEGYAISLDQLNSGHPPERLVERSRSGRLVYVVMVSPTEAGSFVDGMSCNPVEGSPWTMCRVGSQLPEP